MTYIVRDRHLILGTAQTLEATMRLSQPYYENFCDVRGIPTGSGGIPFPDIRDGETRIHYIRWEYNTAAYYKFGKNQSNTATWRLVFPGLGPEFRELNLTIDRYHDTESNYRLNYFRLADAHVNMKTGRTDCPSCSNFARPGKFLDMSKWPDEYTVNQVFFWRVYHTCSAFRKQHEFLGDPRDLKF